MISLNGLAVQAGDFMLRDVCLTVADASHGVILGPSGSGKSVLLETIAGLRRPAAGTISIDTHDVTATPPEERGLAYVPQNVTLFPHLKVRDNLFFGSRAHKIPDAALGSRFTMLTELLEIGHLLDRRNPLTLSRGEQQRVAIARALMINPRAILFDEPFSALDEPLRRQLQLQLMRINRELKLTILHVTHDREEAFMLADIIGIMIDGRLQQTGDRDEIYYRPATVDVARFLLNQNIFSGTVIHRDNDNKTLILESHGMKINSIAYNGLKPGDQVHFGIRPEEIMVIRPDKELKDSVQSNILLGEIVKIFKKGGSHIMLVNIATFNRLIEIDIPNFAFRDLHIDEGKTVKISLKKKSIWTIASKQHRDMEITQE